MAKLIDAEVVKEYLKRVIWGADPKIDGWVEVMPAVDAAPVVHGKWEYLATEHNAYSWQVDAVCSCCGFVKYGVWSGFFPDVPSETAKSVALRYASKVKPPRHCESCGARMDGDADGKA